MNGLSLYPDVDEAASFLHKWYEPHAEYREIQEHLERLVAAGGDIWVSRFSVGGEIGEVLVLCPTHSGVIGMDKIIDAIDMNGMYLYVHTFCRHPDVVSPVPWRAYMKRAEELWPKVEYAYFRRSSSGVITTKRVNNG